ncbi:MAG: type II secretion system F family protein [Anaerolineae bacterium]|nr:type II secretion system F family protein [Anaerolineae bacterium]
MTEPVTAIAILFAELVALAVGTVWVGIEIRRQRQHSVQRLEQAVSGQMLAPTLELQEPFRRRVLEPFFRRLLRGIGRVSPQANLEKLRRHLVIAGSPLGLGPLDFLGLRIVLASVAAVGLAGAVASLTGSFLRAVAGGLACALLFAELPRFWLSRRMHKRRRAILLALPDALDMLTVCVDGGLGLENAFLKLGESWNHALAQEFRRAVAEIGYGISWRDAMRNMVYRTDVPELSGLVAVLLQADQLGFSISDTLHIQADQLRMRRRQRAQELARAAPLKMLFPMVFFILPATFAVILGPAVPAILEAFGVR